MYKIILPLLVFSLSGFYWVRVTRAQTLEISGNGANSHQAVVIDSGETVNVVQTNKSEIINIINASSSTGENTLDSSEGGTISTGDATTKVQVTNLINQNVVNNTCCQDPITPTPKPATLPTTQPTPSPTPTNGPSISVIGNSTDNHSSISDPAIGGAPVLGLSNTSSTDNRQLIENLSLSLGVLCLVASAFVLKSTFHN